MVSKYLADKKPGSFRISFMIVFILFLLITNFLQAQEVEKKPKIGLVLSGGGAKGLAHIGVLKVLDEKGIKVDYIGGTSMGAIIGGLYASGYSGNQIDSIFKATNFELLLSDYIPRTSKNFYEKRNDETYALTLPFNNFKIGAPPAFSKGLSVYSLLSKLTNNVRFQQDFNKLPIPFLCIATDIESGKQVVLNKGNLPQSILASAALPSLFSPVIINNQVLVDGGVANNYPIDEVRKLGADIIIGVDVQDSLRTRKDLKDATKILIQISNLGMIERMEEKRKETEIYIKPDISSFNVISFSHGESIIKKGEEATMEVYDKLREYASNEPLHFDKINRPNSDSLSLAEIKTPKLQNYTRAYVLGNIGLNYKDKISYGQLKEGIDKLNATQNFSSIGYSFEKNDADCDVMNLYLTENPTKTFLKFGLHYDGLYKSGVLINLTHKKLIFKNDVVSFDVVLGDHFRYYLDYYIDNGFYWSFGFKSRFNTVNKNAITDFNNGETLDSLGLGSINMDFLDISNQMYVQTLFARKFIAGLGVEHKFFRFETNVIQQTAVPLYDRSSYLSLFGYVKYDSFDNKYFPRKGVYFSGDIKSFVYSTDYTNRFNEFSMVKGQIGFAKNFFKRATVVLKADVGFSIGENSVPFFNYVLGGYGFNPINGFTSFYGYDFLSIGGNSYVKGDITLDYEIFRKNHINFSTNIANIGSNIFEDTEKWLAKPHYTGYAIGYGMESIIGPLEIKHSWSPETKDHYTWFSVGFWF
jgi:NTE family protein